MSQSVDIKIGDRICNFPALTGGPGKGGFAFGMYKAGSTMLNNALRRVTTRTTAEGFNFIQVLRTAGIVIERGEVPAEAKRQIQEYLSEPGVVYSGWREFPGNYDLPLHEDTRTYLLIRDPRDILTSHYFSLKFSHTTKGPDSNIEKARSALQDVDIDSFALSHINQTNKWFDSYEPLQKTNLMLRRYEDIIFDKLQFLMDVCEHFGIKMPRPRLERIAVAIDERPETEDVNKHIRKVTPGDHRDKLKPETIAALNTAFRKILKRYDYAENVAA